MAELIATTAQRLNFGAIVTLLTIDATEIGGSIIRITPGPYNESAISFDDDVYSPIPFELTGMSWNIEGSLPKPTLKASNIDGQFVLDLINLNDLVGAKVTVVRTFEYYLDDGPDPDPTIKFPDEEFYIDTLVSQDNETISWRLSTVLDQKGVQLPRRQIIRNLCVHRYRRWNGTAFDYSKATCPYTGTAYFNSLDQPTSAAADRCGKQLSGCKARFGPNAILPTRSFPGAALVRNDI